MKIGGVLEIDGGVIKVNDREKLRRISRVNDYFFNLDSILTTYETAFMALISGDQSDAAIIDRRDLQEKVRTFK